MLRHVRREAAGRRLAADRFRERANVMGTCAATNANIADIHIDRLFAELGDLTRFASPRALMGYLGLVPREDSS